MELSLDTNCLLRWLIGDVAEHMIAVEKRLNMGNNVIVSDEAIIEMVWVLDRLYGFSNH